VFHFTGKISKLDFKLGEEELTVAERKEMYKHLVRPNGLIIRS
jgi:hypothetical protein